MNMKQYFKNKNYIKYIYGHVFYFNSYVVDERFNYLFGVIQTSIYDFSFKG